VSFITGFQKLLANATKGNKIAGARGGPIKKWQVGEIKKKKKGGGA